MFTGSTQVALDGKGRMAIPARLRERLAQAGGGQLVLTADPTSGCLLLYPYPEWERFPPASMRSPASIRSPRN
jgi:MraZ protein